MKAIIAKISSIPANTRYFAEAPNLGSFTPIIDSTEPAVKTIPIHIGAISPVATGSPTRIRSGFCGS